MPRYHAPMRHGFTLIELSVVLVIIGLVAGGITAGSAMLEAAELRSITKEYQEFTVALGDFHDRFDAIPGDFHAAQSIWGVAHATPATCITTASSNTLTCNGNGNGVIEDATSAGSNEKFRFWQHLVNAGTINGNFNGISQGGTAKGAVPDVNVPRSQFDNGAWSAVTQGVNAGNSAYFALDYGNVLIYGGPIANDYPVDKLLTPAQLSDIDRKIDDNKPAAGKVVAVWWDDCTTAANFSDTSARYLLNEVSTQCAIYFTNAF